MSEEKELIVNILDDIRESVELFYQQKTGEALQQFVEVLDKMVEMVDKIFAYKSEHNSFELDEDKIKYSLTEAMRALEDQDMILLADIIQYDFIECVENIIEKME